MADGIGVTFSFADSPPPSASPRVAVRTATAVVALGGTGVGADVERLLVAVRPDLHVATRLVLATPTGDRVLVTSERAAVVGRAAEDADLVVEHAEISRRHCSVTITGRGAPEVQDLGSANGTWIHRGNQRIDLDAGRPVRLEPGDWIRSGQEVALAYVDVEDVTA